MARGVLFYKSCGGVSILQKDQQNQIPPLSPDTFLNSKTLSTDTPVNVESLGKPLLWGTVAFLPRKYFQHVHLQKVLILPWKQRVRIKAELPNRLMTL